jgi:hypothetical protein
MICAPVDHFAIGFEISSEKNAPTKPTDRGEDEQRGHVDALGAEPRVEAQHVDDDRQQNHDRQVGGQEQDNSLHGLFGFLQCGKCNLSEGMPTYMGAAAAVQPPAGGTRNR